LLDVIAEQRRYIERVYGGAVEIERALGASQR
jgi:hypothetical protein